VNRVSVRNANNPMPTGHGEVGTKLLSSFEDGHYSNQVNKKRGPIMAHEGKCLSSITSDFVIRVYAKS
jgi:hypothetical protein